MWVALTAFQNIASCVSTTALGAPVAPEVWQISTGTSPADAAGAGRAALLWSVGVSPARTSQSRT